MLKIKKFTDVCMTGGMHYTPSHTNVSLRTQTYFRLSLVPPKITSANSSQKLISVT